MAKATPAIPAIEFLGSEVKPRPVAAIFGGETFLRRQALNQLREAVLGSDDGEFSLNTFNGETAELRDVLGELSTIAMFGGGARLVVVEAADDFISKNRAGLEDYVAKPSSSGVLVLVADSFPSNTKLYKAVVADGLAIDCSPPTGNPLLKWLVDWGKRAHSLKLASDAAELLVETVGPELGLLDQELAKLGTVTDQDRKVTGEMVRKMVGGWRTKTTWDMLDAALDGQTANALVQLDRLLLSGETPVGLLAQISATLRRLATATRVVIQAEEAGRRPSVRSALEAAGVKGFVIGKVESQLRRLGRARGSQLYQWLMQADLDLKGDSAMTPRMVLERLILRIAIPETAVRP